MCCKKQVAPGCQPQSCWISFEEKRHVSECGMCRDCYHRAVEEIYLHGVCSRVNSVLAQAIFQPVAASVLPRLRMMMAASVKRDLKHLWCFDRGELEDLVGVDGRMDATLQEGAECRQGLGLVLNGAGAHASLEPAELGGEMSILFRGTAYELEANKYTRLFDFSNNGEEEHIFMDVHRNGEATFQTYTGTVYGAHPRVYNFHFDKRVSTLVGTVKDDTIRFYKDGLLLLQKQSPGRQPPSLSRSFHQIGSTQIRRVASLNGCVVSMAIWSRELNAGEVKTLCEAEDHHDLVVTKPVTLNPIQEDGKWKLACTNAAGNEVYRSELDEQTKVRDLQEVLLKTVRGCSELNLCLLTQQAKQLGLDDWEQPLMRLLGLDVQDSCDLEKQTRGQKDWAAEEEPPVKKKKEEEPSEPVYVETHRDNNKKQLETTACTVFVNNVPNNATEDEIKDLFSQCGDVDEVRIPRDSSGLRKGFVFVQFAKSESFKAALKMKPWLGHRFLTVAASRPKPIINYGLHASGSTSAPSNKGGKGSQKSGKGSNKGKSGRGKK